MGGCVNGGMCQRTSVSTWCDIPLQAAALLASMAAGNAFYTSPSYAVHNAISAAATASATGTPPACPVTFSTDGATGYSYVVSNSNSSCAGLTVRTCTVAQVLQGRRRLFSTASVYVSTDSGGILLSASRAPPVAVPPPATPPPPFALASFSAPPFSHGTPTVYASDVFRCQQPTVTSQMNASHAVLSVVSYSELPGRGSHTWRVRFSFL